MKHEEIKRLIQKDLDRETTNQEKEVLNEHLAGCTHCLHYYNEMVSTSQAIGYFNEHFPRHDFNARVLGKIGVTRKKFAWIKLLPALAGAWLASTICVVLLPFTGSFIGKVLTSVPAAKRFYEGVKPVAESLGHFLMPFMKNFITSPIPYAGLIFCILLTFALSRLMKKEETCKA